MTIQLAAPAQHSAFLPQCARMVLFTAHGREPIETKLCGTRGRWAWRLLKVTAPRLLASDVQTAAPRATLSLDVNVARAGDDYDSGDVQ